MFKTLIAGYPSGDKRLTFVQMEALTGLSARDEWDFAHLGPTNQPFIKANYPHHEGIWAWGSRVDQVVIVVCHIRRSMVEYHDILWDIGYAHTNLYSERAPINDFYVWRDERVLDEIDWYGWWIDFYMENGLMRDMLTHNITTPEHWYMLMQPTRYKKAEMTYDLIVGNDAIVQPSYDPHCLNDVPTCIPVEIISAERLIQDSAMGRAEGVKIANTLVGKQGIDDWLIEEEAWECIWEELIIHRKGLKTVLDRCRTDDDTVEACDETIGEQDYNFSEEMLTKMISELNRLIIKYSASGWAPISVTLVELLTEHRADIQQELIEVQTGVRTLTQDDFLGTETRRKMKDEFAAKAQQTSEQ